MNPQPKNKPLRSKKACAWFRTQQCAVCGSPETCGHHEPLNGHGIATKGPDNQQIPLCHVHHRDRHDMGKGTFYDRYFPGMRWRAIVMDYKQQVSEYLNPGRDDKR